MRREIGSEFWSIPTSERKNGLFSKDTAWYMSGRSALEAIILDAKSKRDIKVAHLPSWCCDSMIVPFLKNGLDVRFYPIYMKDDRLAQEFPEVKKDEMVLLLDYFGYTGDAQQLCCDGTVVRDLTHSVFSGEYSDADYYFGSLRKWCGFKTGGFARGLNAKPLSPDGFYVAMREKAFEAKAKYISGESSEKDFLKDFARAEERLEDCPIYGADNSDVERAEYLDVELLKTKRRRNAELLLGEFADIAIFKRLKENDCPLFVPVLLSTEERDALRRHLISKEIYLPIHWPISQYHRLNGVTEKIYGAELSLVCDQRYGDDDMCRMVEAVKEFFKR